VQALRRAQPRILVTRFGVRDKLKPFSSMILFSQPRASDQIPIVQDPVGSFIDVEQLSYYVWLNAEKNPAYRKKTLYLFLAEGVNEMLAIRSDVPAATASRVTPARLSDVCATMAHWLGVPLRGQSGRPIDVLIS
jgi:dTDP-4-dehydrorhamnose reductase